jgi:hypothetical protein
MVHSFNRKKKPILRSRGGSRPCFELMTAVTSFRNGYLAYLRHGDGSCCLCSDLRQRTSLLKGFNHPYQEFLCSLFTTSDSLQVPKVECSGVLQGHSKLRKNSRAVFWNVKSARQFVHFVSFAGAQCAELSLVKHCADWSRLARGVKAQ